MSTCIIDVVSGDFVLCLCVSTEVFLFCRRHGHWGFILVFECLHRAFYFLSQTSDWTVHSSILLSDTIIMAGFPSKYSEHELKEKLPENTREGIEKVNIFPYSDCQQYQMILLSLNRCTPYFSMRHALFCRSPMTQNLGWLFYTYQTRRPLILQLL